MATYKRSKSGGSQSEGASNSASPASSIALSNPSSSQGINNNAPKYGTLVPNRIFVGGISSNTTEAELCQLFSKYGNVKATKIIADRAGVSKGYGFVTFESEEEVKFLCDDANNIGIVLKERRLNIAPAIKKQPCNRSLDASTPPPTTPNLYFHNGVPYTFHNGMAFFPSTAHQPAIAALPPTADPSMYPPYGPPQSAAPPPYGAPVLMPAPPPMYMPQNFPYQPLPMTNGGPQYIYASSGSSNSGSGSPMAGTPDTSHVPTPLPPQFYPPHFAAPPEAYYPQPIYIYSYNTGDYEGLEHHSTNDDCRSTVSTPPSDTSDRSSNRSSLNTPVHSQHTLINESDDSTGPSPQGSCNRGPNQPTQATSDSQVPVVSWQSLQNQALERTLHVRDGRRAFHPVIPPPHRPPPPMLLYQQPHYPNNYSSPSNVYQQQKQIPVIEGSRRPRQNPRGRSRSSISSNSVPFIPKFPASFNNNSPFVTNNNFYDKKSSDIGIVKFRRSQENLDGFVNNKSRVNSRGNQNLSPPLSKTSPTIFNSYVPSPSPQMMQMNQHMERQFGPGDRSMIVATTTTRWSSNPPATQHHVKRVAGGRRPNGPTSSAGMSGNAGNPRLAKKIQGGQEGGEGDVGGGGDTQPFLQLSLTPPATPSTNQEITSKMHALSLANSS